MMEAREMGLWEMEGSDGSVRDGFMGLRWMGLWV
jgi:hypothetical protein